MSKVVTTAGEASLQEINNSVELPKSDSFLKKLWAYSGPGALVAVGYMDPGNWITSIGGGARFGYLLLSVIAISSVIAMILQYMSAKLGIVTQMDLAQATRAHTGKKTGFILWIFAELAIMATDIAEVIGGAIALYLLFNIPLLYGVMITIFDVFLVLILANYGFRRIEALVITLIATILFVFIYEVLQADPNVAALLNGFIPRTEILHREQLIMALGIIGATVMPHNLYLHSSIVQSRKYDRQNETALAEAVRFAKWDSNIQLSGAFIVNCLLLILGSALFFGVETELGTFSSLYNALQDPNLSGSVASPLMSTLFAIALLASGQNSTITGTLTGQIVMEGFIHLRISPAMRRIITRLISVTPVIVCTLLYGGNETALDNLLIYSQVFLCLALPLSMFPLVYFTSSSKIMGERFKNSKLVATIGWVCSILLTILNMQLIYSILIG